MWVLMDKYEFAAVYEGLDVVVGWRRNCHSDCKTQCGDAFISKHISIIFKAWLDRRACKNMSTLHPLQHEEQPVHVHHRRSHVLG
jgi:hypothetical protein